MDSENTDNSTPSSPASLIQQSQSSFTLPSRTTRGRRGSRGGRAVRRGVRTRGGRGRGQNRRVGGDNLPNRAELAEAAREARHAQVQERINTIPPNELREFVMQIYRRQPSFVLDIINLPSDQGSQGPPRDEPPNADIPDWCLCTHCRTMPTPEENVCCQQRPQNCHSRLRDFETIVLDELVLQVARRLREDMLVQPHDNDFNRGNRHAAYRQYILWIHGHLGAGNRRVIPSCVVLRIRNKYPDPLGQYVGFIPGRLG